MIRKQFLTLVLMSSLGMSGWAQATQPCIVKGPLSYPVSNPA